MDDKNKGVSVKELEEFTKKHRFEVVFCLSFIIACLFSFVFFGAGWALVFAAAGAVLGFIFPAQVEKMVKAVYGFVFKQEKITQIIMGVVVLIISIFIPPLIFLKIGLFGGKGMQYWIGHVSSERK